MCVDDISEADAVTQTTFMYNNLPPMWATGAGE